MKQFITTILLTTLLTIVYAQPGGGKGFSGERPKIGNLSGKVVDAENGENLSYTKIFLLSKRDSSVVTGGLAGEDGSFIVEEIPAGRYIAKFTAFGYAPFFKDSLFFIPKKPSRDIGSVKMKKDEDLLNTVEVVHDAGEFQVQIDKKVFNVEKQITAQGGTALDALENVPSVSIDMDGNVSLRGSANVTILIDGRPSSLTGGGRSAVLESIPASSIESIEIITNPSAKYDPDGMSGIINIITKKNKLKGFNGNIDLSLENGIHPDSLDTYPDLYGVNYNLSGNLAFRNKWFNIYGGYTQRHYEGYRDNNSLNESWYNEHYLLAQNRTGTHLKNSLMIKSGMDFYLHKNHTMGVSFRANISDNNRTGDQWYREEIADTLSDIWQRISNDPDKRLGYDGNVYYTWRMKKEGQKLDFSAQYSAGSNSSTGIYTENDYDIYTEQLINANYLNQSAIAGNGSNISTVQLDYYHPLKKGKIELGAKSIFRDLRESYYQETEGIPDDSLNNRFSYNEQVHAVYGIFGQEFEKFKYQIGLRLEQVFVLGQLDNDPTDYTNNYFAFYPSAHLVKPLTKTSELSLSYSRRVNRPHTRQLNPFPRYSDPYNLRKGTPELNPEFINSVEFAYGTYGKKLTLTSSIFYRYMTDMIQRITNVDSTGVNTVSYQNVDQGHFYGVELVSIYRPYKWWRIMLTGNMTQTFLNSTIGEADLNNSGINWSTRLMSTFNIKKSWTIQLTAHYRSGMIFAQGNSLPMYGADLAVKYTFFDRKMYLNLRLKDVFNTRRFAYKTEQVGQFRNEGYFKHQSQRIMLTFGYRFGNQDPSKRKKGEGERPSGGGEEFGM